jgi:hypothetical protein
LEGYDHIAIPGNDIGLSDIPANGYGFFLRNQSDVFFLRCLAYRPKISVSVGLGRQTF